MNPPISQALVRQGSRAEREAHAKRLRDEGMLLREIGAEMGVSLKTVSAWLTDPGGAKLRAPEGEIRRDL